MGREASIKLLRGQMRQVVKELFPELVKQELYVDASKLIKTRLDEIHTEIRSELTRINDRQKDIQSILLKELASSKLPTLEPRAE